MQIGQVDDTGLRPDELTKSSGQQVWPVLEYVRAAMSHTRLRGSSRIAICDRCATIGQPLRPARDQTACGQSDGWFPVTLSHLFNISENIV